MNFFFFFYLYRSLLNIASNETAPLPRKIQSLRLLEAILPSWDISTTEKINFLEKLFQLLGTMALICHPDPSLRFTGIFLE